MAKKSRPTFHKRQREMARQQRQQDKMARRLAGKESGSGADTVAANAVDPDIAHIVPGPQPIPPEFELPSKLTPEEP